jgi:hypothetical protein
MKEIMNALERSTVEKDGRGKLQKKLLRREEK